MDVSFRMNRQYLKLLNAIQYISYLIFGDNVLQAEDLIDDTQLQEKRAFLLQRRAAWIDDDTNKRKSFIETSLLESLKFSMMPQRMENIARAHEKTFKWIFEDPAAIHKPWDSFIQWLRNENGIYWITGKAASGKSTLMKYISQHPATQQGLEIWMNQSESLPGKILTGRFFFWNSGIPEQRSQIGLLRSLLYEILSEEKGLISEVFASEWEHKRSLVSHGLKVDVDDWSLSRLEEAFRVSINLKTGSPKFCFFIDGLDEFQGDYSRMGTLLNDLASSTNVKICVSSRPWPVFEAIFKDISHLRLQDLTYDDIESYVTRELLETEYMQQLINEDPEDTSARDIVDDIVTKAAGVFLWVVIVARSLVNGLKNGDGVQHLRMRLDLLPDDLEDLYEHMLGSIEEIYLSQTSQIFQIFRAADYNLTIPVLNGTLEATLEDAMLEFRHPMKLEDLKLRHKRWLTRHRARFSHFERVQSQLNSRTKGLLEVNHFKRPAIEGSLEVKFPRITYLHRTARDYIESPKVWNSLLMHTRATQPEPKAALFMYHLTEIKNKDEIRKPYMEKKALIMMDIARHLDESSFNTRTILVDELDKVFTHASNLGGSRAFQEHWSNGMIDGTSSNIWSLSYAYGLHWYIASKLKAEPGMTTYATQHLSKVLENSEKPELPLLGYALSLDQWSSQGGCVPDLEFLQTLLQYKVDPNQRHVGYTLWQYVLEYLYLAYNNSSLDRNLAAVWSRTLRLLLQFGADPWARCTGDRSIWLRAFDNNAKREWGFLPSSWLVYPHVQQQDAGSVIKTVFQQLPSREIADLNNLLEEKRVSSH
jgi:hypothetical protein